MTPTQEELKSLLLYDPCTGAFVWRENRGKAVRGSTAGSPWLGYLRIGIKGKRYRAHRLAWVYIHGVCPASEIDHINGNRMDNRISNLRLCQAAHNAYNQQNQRRPHGRNKSGFLGVSFSHSTNNWRAFIHYGGKLRNLGGFNTPEEAHQKYLKEKRKHHSFCTL